MRGCAVIEIPNTPPSLNTWLSRHWRVRERDKAAWVREINLRCHELRLPRCDRVVAHVLFRFPDRRRRDTGNYSATLEKCLGDALRPDFIADDDSQRFAVVSAGISPERGPKLTRIVLEWEG